MNEAIRHRRFISALGYYLPIVLLGLAVSFLSNYIIEIAASRVITYLLVFVQLLIVGVPIIRRFKSRNFDLVEPGIWFTLYYFGLFGVRAIYDLAYGTPILRLTAKTADVGIVNFALVVSILGLVMFWLGYRFSMIEKFGWSIRPLPGTWNWPRVNKIAIMCLGLGWIFRLIIIYMQAGSIPAWIVTNKGALLTQSEGITYFEILGNLSAVGLMLIFISAKVLKKLRYWIPFYVLVIPELAYRFIGGSRAQFVFFLLTIVVCLYMCSNRDQAVIKRYLPWCIFLTILLIVLFPILTVFRGGMLHLGLRFLKMSNLWKNPLNLFNVIWARQHGLDSLAAIMQHVPAKDPHLMGSEILLLFVAWVPRLVWPGKPIIDMGGILYERYFPHIFGEGVSIAPTLPGEFYWSFNILGVIAGMILIGLLWRFLNDYLVKPKGNLTNTLFVSILFPVFFITAEQTLVDLLTIPLLQIILLVLISYIIRGNRPVSRAMS